MVAALAVGVARGAEEGPATQGAGPDGETPGAVETTEASKRAAHGWLRNVAGDFRYLVTFPARRSPEGTWKAAAILGGIGGLVLLDDEIRREVQDRQTATLDRWERRIEPLGKVRHTSLAAAAVYGFGRVAGQPRVAETGRALIEALFLTEVLDIAAKGAFGRKEPNPDTRASDFFKGSSFFPSGHTARAFAFATVLAERHGGRAAWVAYPIASLVGLSRIERDVHWVSDVAAGAALGHFVSRAVVKRRAEREGATATREPPARILLVPASDGIEVRLVIAVR